MPCNADYMMPAQSELNSKRVAGLIVYVQDMLAMPITEAYQKASKEYYGNVSLIDAMTYELCELLTDLEENHPRVAETVMYNGRNKQARDLADWWEEHQTADRKRTAAERKAEEAREKEYKEYIRLKKKFGK